MPSAPPSLAGQQVFGAAHTQTKLEMLESYLPAFTTALQSRFRLHYVDAFAGTGDCYLKVPEGRLRVPGSASLAIDCTPRFHKLAFIEKSPWRCRALERLKQRHPAREVLVIRDDANVALPDYIRSLDKWKDRAVIFLDPFGMHVEWRTLQTIAASKIPDVWYLFPLFGLYRQASRNAAAIDADKWGALTKLLGTEEWRDAFYERRRQESLFGDTPDVRHADVPEMLAWVKKRLQTIFAAVAEPKVLHQMTKSGKRGAPMFALFFLVSNPSPPAMGLALRIANSILRA